MKKEEPFFVRFDEVPKAGIRLETLLTRDWLSSVLTSAYRTTEARPALKLTIEKDDGNLLVTGQVSFTCRFDCSRCAEPAGLSDSVMVKAVFAPAQRKRLHLVDAEVEDGGLDAWHTFDGNAFCIEQPFVDAVTTSLEPYPLCSPDCVGLCPHCGAAAGSLCGCREEAVDPRWAALAKLKEKMSND